MARVRASRVADRRGTILLSVLVVVVIASLTGATAMYVARAQTATASVTLRRAQARALAWSGVQAVMAELAEQREALLDGEVPRVTTEWELYEEDGNRAVVRLLPMGRNEVSIASEAGRLNINTATATMLVAAGFDQQVAQAIIEERGGEPGAGVSRPYSSVEDLLRVAGVSANTLNGILDEEWGADEGSGLAESLTVWSFDPSIQSGLGNDASRHRGNLRVNLNLPWSDRLAEAIDDRFGPGASRLVKQLMDEGTKFTGPAEIVAVLKRLNIEHKEWPAIFDAFTMSDDPYLPGKVDLMRAPAEVLAAVPGIGRDAAEQIVTARDGVDREIRSSIAWPVIEGILTPDEFAEAAEHLTTRSLQWRVRIEAGIAAPTERFSASRDAGLRDRIVLEAVIDVASERPQVAYLRDVTMREAATLLYQTLVAGDEPERSGRAELDLESILPPIPGEARPRQPMVGSADIPGLRMPGISPRSGISGRGGGLWQPRAGSNSGSGRNLSPSTGGFGDLEFGGLDFGAEAPLPISGPEDIEALAAGPEELEAGRGVDRRLGRWTTGGGSSGRVGGQGGVR
jgi:DNA uptake protein ComE-like DNA-binding protein